MTCIFKKPLACAAIMSGVSPQKEKECRAFISQHALSSKTSHNSLAQILNKILEVTPGKTDQPLQIIRNYQGMKKAWEKAMNKKDFKEFVEKVEATASVKTLNMKSSAS